MKPFLPAGAFFFLSTRPAWACSICFGAQSPDLAKGFYWGVLLLLALPPVIILSFVGMVAYHVRRNKRFPPSPAE